MAGFTTMSEAVTGAQLAQVLNLYLNGMVRVIQQHDGLVDKFIGDAVFAMFNVPLDQPDHYERAVRCFDGQCESAFRANAQAWKFFQAQPAGYRRLNTWWVMSAKREDTRTKRLAVVIEASGRGIRLDPMKSPFKQVTGLSAPTAHRA